MTWEAHTTNEDILRAAIKSMERGAGFSIQIAAKMPLNCWP